MKTPQEHFSKLTVAQLKDLLGDFKAVGLSKLKKIELVNMLVTLMDGAHRDAENEYAVYEEDKYIAEREAKLLFTYKGVKFNTGWDCCRKAPVRAMTFDDGTVWGVCIHCSYRGGNNKISDLPKGAIRAHSKDLEKRDDEGFYVELPISRQTIRIRTYVEQMGSFRAVTPRQMKRIIKNANRILKRNGTFDRHPNLMTISGKRKAEKASA